MTDKLHTFSLGEICEPVDTNYRKAKRSGEHDTIGRKMPVVKRKFTTEVSMTNKEYERFKLQVMKMAYKIVEMREK